MKNAFDKECYGFGDLVDIVALLRGENGCPWDREQDHRSIRKNLIEETYEVCEAIDKDDDILMAEELGDLLLQTVFHAQIAKDRGAFDIGAVTTGICKKLIRRHPHIFGDTVALNTSEVLRNWEDIKRDEKNLNSVSSSMDSVPRQLPALMRADKLQSKAAKAGFDWDGYEGARQKVAEESAELDSAIEKGDADAMLSEMGDLIFSVVNLSRKLDIEPEEALTAASDKFLSRFIKVEEMCRGKNLDMKKMSLTELDRFWDIVKSKE